jgi:hypothetical protein
LRDLILRHALLAVKGRFALCAQRAPKADVRVANDFRRCLEIGRESGPTSARNLDCPLVSKVSAAGGGLKGGDVKSESQQLRVPVKVS